MLSPSEQVAAILKSLHPGDCPAIPPFLLITPETEARRRQNWLDHPPVAVSWRQSRIDAVTPQVPEDGLPSNDPAAILAMKEEVRREKEKARLAEVALRRECEALALDFAKLRAWDPKTSRWDLAPVRAAIAAAPPEAKDAYRLAQNASKKHRRKMRKLGGG